MSIRLLTFGLICGHIYGYRECWKRYYSENAFGCVCNAQYCDEIEPLGKLEPGKVAIYVSSQSGARMQRTNWYFTNDPGTANIVSVDVRKTFQEVIGFGGAITDSTGENLNSLLDVRVRNLILRSYYSEEGIQYRLTRTPMGSCDFSPNDNTYDDVAGDMDLNNFALLPEDHKFRIPYMKQAQAIARQHGSDIWFLTAPWSAPGWMKTTGKTKGGGRLLGEVNGPYYKTWTKYFIKFLEAYHKEGIDFWGITPGNEPSQGINEDYPFQAMYFDAEMQRDWIKGLLGPTLRGHPLTRHIQLMVGDDNRRIYPNWIQTILSDREAARYVRGSAVHWYMDYDPKNNISVIDETRSVDPDKFILYTEACHGGVKMGDWDRGEQYAHSIIENMNHGVAGWIDWNMALNAQGGPSYIGASVDAPIIVNATAQEFIKQPMFYAIGHFSKFIKPLYKRVKLTVPKFPDVEGISFVSPDGKQRVLVLLNTNSKARPFSIRDEVTERNADVLLHPKSIMTIIWNA